MANGLSLVMTIRSVMPAHGEWPLVMAGLVPAIHVFAQRKTWMPATSAGMTEWIVMTK